MRNVRCIAVDDEPIALAKLKSYIEKTPNMEVVAACEDAMEALAVLSGEGADAMFIDINMPDVNGLDFVGSLRQKPIVVFVTAYAQYAADSFKVAPVDYLLKPYAFADFQRAACRVVRQFELEQKAERPVGEAGSLYVKVDYRYVRVELKDIRYIEGMSDYLRIHLAGEPRPLITHSTFRQIAEYLSPNFLQVHKSYIVNMDQVREIQRMRIVMDSETLIPVGDSYKDTFTAYLAGRTVGKRKEK